MFEWEFIFVYLRISILFCENRFSFIRCLHANEVLSLSLQHIENCTPGSVTLLNTTQSRSISSLKESVESIQRIRYRPIPTVGPLAVMNSCLKLLCIFLLFGENWVVACCFSLTILRIFKKDSIESWT